MFTNGKTTAGFKSAGKFENHQMTGKSKPLVKVYIALYIAF